MLPYFLEHLLVLLTVAVLLPFFVGIRLYELIISYVLLELSEKYNIVLEDVENQHQDLVILENVSSS